MKTSQNIQTRAKELVSQSYRSPSVLTKTSGDILDISGRRGQFLELAAGKANWNIFAMALDGLRYELTVAFQKALKQDVLVDFKESIIPTSGGERHAHISIKKQPESTTQKLRMRHGLHRNSN